MKRKFNLIPFFLTRECYSLSGIQKEIARLKYDYHESYERDLKILGLKIDNHESIEYKKEDLLLQHHYGIITNHQYQKELHTIDDLPYVEIIDSKYIIDDSGRGQMMFEFDWNHQFVLHLKKEGYGGFTPDEIVDNWFTDVCEQNARTNYLYGPD